ncbi:MAG: phage integrase SAM-like domain-containing protein [Bacteroidia bacterium]
MASIQIKLGRLQKRTGKQPVYFELIHNRRHTPIGTGINIHTTQWNKINKGKSWIVNHENSNRYNSMILEQLNKINRILEDHLNKPISIESLRTKILDSIGTAKPSMNNGHQSNSNYIGSFTDEHCQTLLTLNRAGLARSYKNAVNQLVNYKGSDFLIAEMDFTLLNSFKVHLLQKGISKNTIGAYFRAYRRLWNISPLHKNFKKENYPFERGLIPGRQRTKKKSIGIEPIKVLENYSGKLSGTEQLAVDCLLLQFYFRGMDFIDVVLIKGGQVTDGYLEGQRYKNRDKDNPSFFTVKIIPKAQKIIAKYASPNRKYILPVLDGIDLEFDFKQVLKTHQGNNEEAFKYAAKQDAKYNGKRSVLYKSINKLFKRIGLDIKVTSKAIRHTWITIADSKTEKFHLVRYAAAHNIGTETMTETYLKYDQDEIDRLNEIVCCTE